MKNNANFNYKNKIIKFRTLSFNRILVCLFSLLCIWIINYFYQYDNFIISIFLYTIIIFFILRQLFTVGVSFQDDVNNPIDFRFKSNGWTITFENNKKKLNSKVVYKNRTNLKWVNNVEIVLIRDKDKTSLYCNTYSVIEVISIFHFIDEQRLLNEFIYQK